MQDKGYRSTVVLGKQSNQSEKDEVGRELRARCICGTRSLTKMVGGRLCKRSKENDMGREPRAQCI